MSEATTPIPADTYLGDGVYARYDGWHVRLWTSDGIQETNVVYLDPHVLAALAAHVEEAR